MRAASLWQVTKDLCTGCHNADSPFVGEDFVFDFEANKDKGMHRLYKMKNKH